MDYSLFFNHLSLPASGEEEAYSLLIDSFQGVLNLNQNQDRFFLYFDGASLDDCKLSEGFTYSDFKSRLSDQSEIDLLTFIYEIEDKSPLLDRLSAELTDELSRISSYFQDRPYNSNLDIFTIAWLENGTMFSLATEKFWQNHIITFFSRREGEHEPFRCEVCNISEREHADFIMDAIESKPWDLCCSAIFTDNFMNWYEECKKEDQDKIKNKLRHCCENNFQFGRPLIDTLSDSRFPNMKEIRIGNAHAQSGKIRILFAITPNRTPAILNGFIKHSNDYTEYIEIADNLFVKVCTKEKLRFPKNIPSSS